MSRHLQKALAIAALALATAAAAQAGSFVERFKAATAAYEAKDYVRMEAELRAALKLRPAHPSATYNLAAALALRGDGKAAVETLETLADQGLVFNPGKDRDFASLKDDRGFKSVRRAFRSNDEPTGRAERIFRLKSPSFIPEGIAYDPDGNDFYIGSVHERRIQRVRGDNVEVDFVKPGAGGLWAPFGMAVDTKRELLWVATTAVPEMNDADPAELGHAAILAYDLETAKPKHRFVLEGEGHALGDVIVVRDGSIYTTDSRAGVLYKLHPKSGRFEALTQPGELSSPQGLALRDDRRGLYVADYTQGLYYYDLRKKRLKRVEVDDEVSTYGIDGLYAYERDLIAIQNGIRPHRVVQLQISGDRVRRARVLASNLKDFDEPTLGVVRRRSFYFIANSQWDRFDQQHRLPPPEQLNRPMVMRITLEDPDQAPGPDQAPVAPAPQQAPGSALPCVPGVTC
jgi:sugar lactone lactonase YvrE